MDMQDWLTNGAIAALSSGLISLIVSHFQGGAAARRELRRRHASWSFEVSKLLVDPQSARNAARRFAVGIVKVVEDPTGVETGKVCFVPANSRVTIGRDPSNDIVFSDTYVSRFHCGIFCDVADVYLEDYRATNRTLLNGVPIELGRSSKLKNGDRLTLGEHTLEFQFVHRSSLLVS